MSGCPGCGSGTPRPGNRRRLCPDCLAGELTRLVRVARFLLKRSGLRGIDPDAAALMAAQDAYDPLTVRVPVATYAGRAALYAARRESKLLSARPRLPLADDVAHDNRRPSVAATRWTEAEWRAVLDRLPESLRAVVALRYRHGLGERAVAARLGKSVRTVARAAALALARLRESLGVEA